MEIVTREELDAYEFTDKDLGKFFYVRGPSPGTGYIVFWDGFLLLRINMTAEPL